MYVLEDRYHRFLANPTSRRCVIESNFFGTSLIQGTLITHIMTTSSMKWLVRFILSFDCISTFVTDVVLARRLNVWGSINGCSAVTADLSQGRYRRQKYVALRLPSRRTQCLPCIVAGSNIAIPFSLIQDNLLNQFDPSSSAAWLLSSSQRYDLQCQPKILQSLRILPT